ncbi:MAG TPA: phosphoglucosamine mutase [Actinomycetales bacterium]
MPRVFGTDGVRGLANGDLTAALALDLAVAGAHVLRPAGGARPLAVVGRDPRASGEFLTAAVVAGLASAGVDVLDVGVLPTPAIAFVTAARDADFGVMLSASHNPMPDNGIKFFTRGGHKLDDEVEDRIEAAMGADLPRPLGADVGRVRRDDTAGSAYVAHLLAAAPLRLEGLCVVLDAAHGAASVVGPELLRAAGAQVHLIGTEPDGYNINDGYGSTHLERLQAAVVAHGADAGIALDGDADRCLAVDASGEVVDGDQVMAVLALAMDEHGQLAERTLVATVMSNLGLLLAMQAAGITVVQAGVGDRYVLELMREGGFSLGGEQSGHVIVSRHGTTGDGLLTGLLLLSRMAETRSSLAELAGVMHKLPQVMVNVPGVDKSRAHQDAELRAAVASAELELAGQGRVLLRPSGTEQLVRVMVEATEAAHARSVAERLAGLVRERLAL